MDDVSTFLLMAFGGILGMLLGIAFYNWKFPPERT